MNGVVEMKNQERCPMENSHCISRSTVHFLSTSLVFLVLLICGQGYSQIKTNNQFIWAVVEENSGRITVMLPNGKVGTDGQLNFYGHSYFSCSINNEIYSNNDVAVQPPNAGTPWQLSNGTSQKIADTIVTTWTRSGIDIIQEVYPIAFERSGQIAMRWKFRNPNNANAASISCQFLNDIAITDPHDPGNDNSNDGPIILHRYAYKDVWQRIPSASTPEIPWFYGAFLRDLPNTNPGISAFGFLDNPTLGTLKPNTVTIGDWNVMSNTAWGHPTPDWPIGTALGGDNAMLLEFPYIGVPKGRTVLGGSTSYGTGEFQVCNGPLVGVLFYPQRLKWDKANLKYNPNPFTVEMLTFNPNQAAVSTNTHFSLTVDQNLTIIDTLRPNPTLIGKSLTLPKTFPPTGDLIPAGAVIVYDWYVLADPTTLCTGDVNRTIKMNGGSSQFPFAFDNDTCEHPIILECAETDVDPPRIYQSAGIDPFHLGVGVADDRPTDRGLKSISWRAQPGSGTDSTEFANFQIVLADSVKPCATDKSPHSIFITQIDSTLGGCIEFTAIDCLGHDSVYVVCMPARPVTPHFDTRKPEFVIIERDHSDDPSKICNSQFDSLAVFDTAQYDTGLKSVQVVSATNMVLNLKPFTSGAPTANFSLTVTDSMKDGKICLVATDNATQKSNISDTFCIDYCTIADTARPKIYIKPVVGIHGSWDVTVTDSLPWDRLIGGIFINGASNVTPTSITVSGVPIYKFTVKTIDTTKSSGFCVNAVDLAGNWSDSLCVSIGVDTDGLAPNINFTPSANQNPTKLTVLIDDIHFNDPGTNKDTNIWDTGIDSVWFSGDVNKFIAVTSGSPPTPLKFNCIKQVPGFQLAVVDSLLPDTACIMINVLDCHKNYSFKTWCFPYRPDVLPPVIKVHYVDKQNIQVDITDSALYDRGLDSIATSVVFNLTDFDAHLPKGNTFKSYTLQRPNLDQSTSGVVTAIDYWASLDASRVPTHSANVNFNVWVQDLAMRKGQLLKQAETFTMPIFFVNNDAVALAQKAITAFKFSFTMEGDVTALTFLGVKTAGTATATGWTVTPTQVGNSITIDAQANAGITLSRPPDTLVYLQFSAQKNESTKEVSLKIDSIGTETVVYNNGKDTIYNGLSATAIMPPPWGNLSGGTVVIIGACAPSLQRGKVSGSIILDVPSPNPIAHRTTLHYGIPTEGGVKLSIYDMLGREVKQLVNESQKEGYYEITIEASELPNGQYNLRLESGNEVQSRLVVVQR
jgi:uncharacterized protein (UPF0218 family)